MAENVMIGLIPTVLGAGLLVYTAKHMLSDEKNIKSMRLLNRI